jgi:hypothetical protein
VIGASTTSTPVFADITDDTAILLSGGERYRHIVERMLTSSAQCRLRAQLALHDEQSAAQTGTLTVKLNPQHEVMDVVTITEPTVNLAGQNARIHGIDTVIDMSSGTWLQHLQLRLP